jgi:hypothetical protein
MQIIQGLQWLNKEEFVFLGLVVVQQRIKQGLHYLSKEQFVLVLLLLLRQGLNKLQRDSSVKKKRLCFLRTTSSLIKE